MAQQIERENMIQTIDTKTGMDHFQGSFQLTVRDAKKFSTKIVSALDNERKIMVELNAKLASLIATIQPKGGSSTQLLETIERLKYDLLQTLTTIKEKHSEETSLKISQLSEELASFEAKVSTLEITLETKDSELTEIMQEKKEFQKTLQKKEIKIMTLEYECKELKSHTHKIRKDIERLGIELEQTLSKQFKAQRKCEQLTEENMYLETTLSIENSNLRKLLSAFEFEQRNFDGVHETEFKQYLKAIQDECYLQLELLRQEQQKSYTEKIKLIESEMSIKRMQYEEKCSYYEKEIAELQQQISDQNIKLQELVAVLKVATSFSFEINTYKTLLGHDEGMQGIEQQTGDAGIKQQVTDVLDTQSPAPKKPVTNTKQEVSKTSQVSPISASLTIKEVETSGSFIVLYNSSKTEEIDLSDWTIERTHPKGKEKFLIPGGCKIRGEKEMKIYSSGSSGKKGPDDLVAPCMTWGKGNGQVKLTDHKGQEVIPSQSIQK